MEFELKETLKKGYLAGRFFGVLWMLYFMIASMGLISEELFLPGCSVYWMGSNFTILVILSELVGPAIAILNALIMRITEKTLGSKPKTLFVQIFVTALAVSISANYVFEYVDYDPHENLPSCPLIYDNNNKYLGIASGFSHLDAKEKIINEQSEIVGYKLLVVNSENKFVDKQIILVNGQGETIGYLDDQKTRIYDSKLDFTEIFNEQGESIGYRQVTLDEQGEIIEYHDKIVDEEKIKFYDGVHEIVNPLLIPFFVALIISMTSTKIKKWVILSHGLIRVFIISLLVASLLASPMENLGFELGIVGLIILALILKFKFNWFVFPLKYTS